MRGIDIFCASQASTAIRLSTSTTMDEPSSSSSSAVIGTTRAIDRHNPIIRDASRLITKSFPPCSVQHPPISPIPYTQLIHHQNKNPNRKPLDRKTKKKGPTKSDDQKRKSSVKEEENEGGGDKIKSLVARKSCGDFETVTPPGSTRYLLGDQHLHRDPRDFLDVVSDFDPVSNFDPDLGLVPHKPVHVHDDSSVSKSSDSPNQVVVVLRVSLHCRGCEGKVRKHISRMKGVTSYNIEFAAKKVTVVGDVTPLGVLASVSKIKAAQLWTTPSSDLKKHKPAAA